MRNFYAVLVSLAIFTLAFFPIFKTNAQQEQLEQQEFVSTSIVISQLYGGGGNTGAVFQNDFVELFNRGSSPVNLNGWSTQYASSGGTEFLVTPLSNVTLQPGQYYLVQYASNGAIGTTLPTVDLVAPIVTNNAGNMFIPNLSSTTGKIALVNSVVRLPASTCPISDTSIIDFVGYGASASCSEGTKTGDLSAATSAKRNSNGCADTDNNLVDFAVGTPTPRNTSTAVSTCNLGASLQAGSSTNPGTVTPNSSTLLRVSVIPATTPPSTGITVTGNLTNFGGSATQQFFDNGTNGDVTPNDNIFSYQYTVAANASGGTFQATGVASDVEGRNVNVIFNLTINALPANDNPLLLGNPSNATSDIMEPNNYLLIKPQYSLSYNRSRGTSNWTAWRLDSTWVGNAPRQDDFRPDDALPAAWYRVTDVDYSGSGYDRGHMCPSGDRTRSVPDNSATFFMTNMIPQLAANNQGPWEDLESYSRTLAGQGNELYIYSGSYGTIGTLAAGNVTIPRFTWKVIVVMPNGENDLSRVNKSTRVIAIVIPNFVGTGLNINDVWRKYRTSVDAIENTTGLNLLSNVGMNTQNIIERRRDVQ
jgi:endonuclease G, mitochondrial